MATTDQQQYLQCDSAFIRTRKHCTCYFRNPKGGYDLRCRNRAILECEHGQHCGECDRYIHGVGKRHQGDFVCVICDKHFHDKDSQEVHDHIAECSNRSAVSRGMEPPFPVMNPIELIDPRTLHHIVARMFQEAREKQN